MREGQVVFWDVVEEHLDEAEFLVTQRDAALDAEDYTLAEVDELLEARLFAQLDGLVVAGEAAVTRLLLPALEDDTEARVLAGALALLATPGERGPAAVVGALVHAADGAGKNAGKSAGNGAVNGAAAALTRAVGLENRAGIDGNLDARLLGELGASSPWIQAAALEALVLRGVAPGRSLARVGPGDAKVLVRAALRAARLTPPSPALGELCEACLSAPDPALRVEAIRSGLVLGVPGALAACRKLAVATGDRSLDASAGEALLLLALAGDARDHATLLEALDGREGDGAPARRRAAVTALGYAGRAAGAEACLGLLGDPALGRLASEAFAAITGAPREGAMLAVTRGPYGDLADEPVPLAEDDLDTRAVPGPDAALPLLDPVAAAAFWSERRTHLDRQSRYIGGKLLRAESALAALTHRPMRRRHALALEVAMRSRGRLAVETRAFAARQRVEIARLGDLGGIDFQRPLG
jgi:uncharacterized protein (TIGR02270 family)